MKNYSSMVNMLAERHGIPRIDLDEELAKAGDPSSCHWEHDGHWNLTGHQRVADALFTFLTRKSPFLLEPVKQEVQEPSQEIPHSIKKHPGMR